MVPPVGCQDVDVKRCCLLPLFKSNNPAHQCLIFPSSSSPPLCCLSGFLWPFVCCQATSCLQRQVPQTLRRDLRHVEQHTLRERERERERFRVSLLLFVLFWILTQILSVCPLFSHDLMCRQNSRIQKRQQERKRGRRRERVWKWMRERER